MGPFAVRLLFGIVLGPCNLLIYIHGPVSHCRHLVSSQYAYRTPIPPIFPLMFLLQPTMLSRPMWHLTTIFWSPPFLSLFVTFITLTVIRRMDQVPQHIPREFWLMLNHSLAAHSWKRIPQRWRTIIITIIIVQCQSINSSNVTFSAQSWGLQLAFSITNCFFPDLFFFSDCERNTLLWAHTKKK